MAKTLARTDLMPVLIRAALLTGAAAGALLATPVRAAEPAAPVATEEVETILVTAQRREQRLQDVGIAVSVVGAQQIAQMGLRDSTDLVRSVPSLKMNEYTPSAVVFNIRGVSQNDFGDAQEPPVAVYQDDSYASSFISSGFPMFDLARVEVLRGPQGTLFGRNATGGAVQFISNKPTKDFSAYVTAGYGSYDTANAEGAISGPITDNLQMRLSGMVVDGDGYLKSVFPGVNSRGAEHHWALRNILTWQPTDRVDVELNVRFARNPHERSAGMYSWEAAYPNAEGQGTYLPGTMVNPLLGDPTAPPGTDLGGYRNDAISVPRGGKPWRVAALGPSFTDRSLFSTNLKVDFPVGPFQVTSITDVQTNQKDYQEDASASPNNVVGFRQGADVQQYSQEVRASAAFGAHELVLGAFGMSIDGAYTASYFFPIYPFIPDVNFSEKTKSYAIFAQDEWTLPHNLKAIFGARYWHDNRTVSYSAVDNTGEVIRFNTREVVAINGSTGLPALAGVTLKPSDADKDFSDYSVRAQLDYKPSDDLLVYASFNRGTKSGGFTLSTSTPTAGFESFFLNGIPYKPEVLNAFEVGVKATLPLRTTLNLTGFHYDYKNYQAFTQYGLVQTVVNRDATEDGFEAELLTHPVRGLTLQANASVLDNVVKDVSLPNGDVRDRKLPQAPKFSGQGLVRYDLPLAPGDLSLQADVQYTGKFCFSVLCSPVEREGAHTVYNARIGFSPKNKPWEASLFINNITSEIYRVYTFDVSAYTGQIPSVYARPRSGGVSVTYRFN
jgi:iron complex outermembrane receptor protein